MGGNVTLHGRDRAGKTGGQPIYEVSGSLSSIERGTIPSSYSGAKSATTTVTGQSEALSSDVSLLDVTNTDGTNFGLIAFGTDAATAETNASSGIVIMPGAHRVIGVPTNATHYAWLGDTGTVVLYVIQGA